MAQWLRCLPRKLEDLCLDPQNLSKCPVSTVAHLLFQPGKVEEGHLQSKLTGDTELIESPWPSV